MLHLHGTSPAYYTKHGATYCGDSRELLQKLPDNSINLVITSPPFALQHKKEYGNKEQHEYVDWLAEFAVIAYQKLRNNGSFVVDLGGAYEKGVPVRSLYNYRVPICFCDDIGFFLAEDFYWHNPSKLPSPTEWVNKRKIRVKDSINTVWWFSKTEYPKADVSKVLVPYSHHMQKLLDDPEKYYIPAERPSGHKITRAFAKNNGGAIPSNLLSISNTESNSLYSNNCKLLSIKPHPARFPVKLPKFFIEYLTEPGDLVVDIFAGSNTTGQVAEVSNRRWLAFEENLEYVAASALRFLNSETTIQKRWEAYCRIKDGESVDFGRYNRALK